MSQNIPFYRLITPGKVVHYGLGVAPRNVRIKRWHILEGAKILMQLIFPSWCYCPNPTNSYTYSNVSEVRLQSINYSYSSKACHTSMVWKGPLLSNDSSLEYLLNAYVVDFLCLHSTLLVVLTNWHSTHTFSKISHILNNANIIIMHSRQHNTENINCFHSCIVATQIIKQLG